MPDVLSLLNEHNIDYILGTTNVKCKCLNPYHKDTHPSMSIRISDGVFRCWSCGIKGHYAQLYNLITGQHYEYNKLEYWKRSILQFKVETVEKPEIKIIGTLKSPLKNSDIRNFLLNIGVLSDNFIKETEIQYSVYTEMIAKHLFDSNVKYTKMSDRICTPIYKDDTLVNMEGRTYKAKKDLYKDEPKVLYVKGGKTDLLYRWNKIDITSDVVVVEGLKDYWKVWSVYNNVVPLFGNSVKDYQAQLLNTVTGNIIAFCDNDEGGLGVYDNQGHLILNGMMQNLEDALNKEFKVCWNPVRGKDPNDTDLNIIKKLLQNAKWNNEVLIDSLFGSLKIKSWIT